MDKYRLAIELENFKKENICEHASNKCNGCTFKIENGCAYNLVINFFEHDLSIYKHEAEEKWNRF